MQIFFPYHNNYDFLKLKTETLTEVTVLSGDHPILKTCLKGQVHSSSSNRNAVEVKKFLWFRGTCCNPAAKKLIYILITLTVCERKYSCKKKYQLTNSYS